MKHLTVLPKNSWKEHQQANYSSKGKYQLWGCSKRLTKRSYLKLLTLTEYPTNDILVSNHWIFTPNFELHWGRTPTYSNTIRWVHKRIWKQFHRSVTNFTVNFKYASRLWQIYPSWYASFQPFYDQSLHKMKISFNYIFMVLRRQTQNTEMKKACS